ncbi:DUF6907 domain-containing protein [Micromonospora maritima]|uniref:DUF6907 domain-containing protein n=1 Tax=Micromonospora maritima TaxID=986711 RepID=UPI00157BEB00|nr:hypothetical protein [Micromonospora maritima]
MTIFATAPVPASSRIIDADTTDLAAIRRDVELTGRAAAVNPSGVAQLAQAIRTGCPPWCSNDHRGQITEEDGFSIGLVHERNLAEITALDPQHFHPRPATVSVYIESSTEAGEPADPARLVMTVAEGAEGQYHGSLDTGGWTGTPAQARALAAALLAGADLVDGGNR